MSTLYPFTQPSPQWPCASLFSSRPLAPGLRAVIFQGIPLTPQWPCIHSQTTGTQPTGSPSHSRAVLATGKPLKIPVFYSPFNTSCSALVVACPQFVMWKVTNNGSSGTDTCKVCLSSYPVCQSCTRYGQTGHLNDVEKLRGAHDNSGFQNDEKKDPRSKFW